MLGGLHFLEPIPVYLIPILFAYLPAGLYLFSSFSPTKHVLNNDKIPSLLNIYEPKTVVSALHVLIDLIPVRTYVVGPSFTLVFKMGNPRPPETKSLPKITELLELGHKPGSSGSWVWPLNHDTLLLLCWASFPYGGLTEAAETSYRVLQSWNKFSPLWIP